MKERIYHFLSSLYSLLPIRRRKMLFLAYYGSQYGCNPKYLSEYMTANHPDWDVVWSFTNPDGYEVPLIRKVRHMSLRFFYELGTCQVLVTNYRMPPYYRRRKGQLYIQTWHSSLRLKAIEADALQSIPAHYIDMARHDSAQINALLSGCQKSTDIFRRAFWYDGEILPTGTPRMDVLVRNDALLKRKVKQRLGIGEDSHVVLYAPTFREDHGLQAYDLDVRHLRESLQRHWGGSWVVLLRLHPHLLNVPLDGQLRLCQDVTSYEDPQELLLSSDVLVTDYSGLMFDFAITRRPCFLYVPDLDAYLEKERQLYFHLEELPFPQINSNQEIDVAIRQFDEKSYHQRVDAFLKLTGTYEDGHASERVYNEILKRL